MSHSQSLPANAPRTDASPPNTRPPRPSRPRRSFRARRAEPVSREAQRMAAAILEVLAGMRTPAGAAVALGITVPRYYVWEQRALAGMLAACEPQNPGGTSPRWRIAMLEKEIVRLKQQCARQEALTRAAQRTIGLAPPTAAKPPTKPAGKASGKPGKKTRTRRAAVRALKAAKAFRAASGDEPPPPATCSGATSTEVLQPCAMSSNPLPPAASGAGASPAPATGG